MDRIIIREIKTEESGVLKSMLYEAIFHPIDHSLIPLSVLDIPKVKIYVEDFGTRNGDYCLVADLAGQIVGAAWVRLFVGDIKGYGYVDSSTPELTIALVEEYRSKGIGTRLMKQMLHDLCSQGYQQVSLSVQKENYAINLYKNLSFKIVEEIEEECVMIYSFD